VKLRSPTTVFLNRARLIFTLTALVPTVFITVIGIVLVATGSRSVAVVGGILVLALCATALAGYGLGTLFVTRGANLAAIQNEFMSAVSHEIRTPLTSIRMFIETLRDEPGHRPRRAAAVPHDRPPGAGPAGRSGRQALDALQDRVAPHGLRSAPRRRLGHRERRARGPRRGPARRGGDLQVSLQPDLVVSGDREALVQAVTCLLVNAWKYTPAEGKRIDVRATGDAAHVTIEVGDNGSGVTAEESGLIFQKFQRGSAAAHSGSVGTGLGLAVVRAIVTAHRATVDVFANQPCGARFRIVLPRARAEAA
jgi:two-component system phosphate regulon sensor histidine kinase PhoR